jgi:uncharacterized membrane protein YdbT with pleckstrin-like domain
MEKPLLVLKPNIINALLPTFIRNLFYSFIAALVLFGVFLLLRLFNFIDYSTRLVIFFLIIFLLVVSIIPLLAKIVTLSITKYYFFRAHVVLESKLIKIKRESVPYHQIVNITIDISLWDRLCKAGDIILHTAKEESPDIILYYIKEPEKIESALHRLIIKTKKSVYGA